MKAFLIGLVVLGTSVSAHAETWNYRETSQGKVTTETVTVTRSEEGAMSWETFVEKDSVSRAGRGPDGSLKVFEVRGKEGQIILAEEGDLLTATGTWQGKAVKGSLPLKGRVWAMGFEQPLRWSVQHKLTTPLTFLMVNPQQVAQPTEMLLTPDGKEVVNGNTALRFKLGLPGAMSLFWSAVTWADPASGAQVKYAGNKGPGTPDVVLVIERTP